MSALLHHIAQIFNSVVFYYALIIIAVYAGLAFFSALEIKHYLLRNKAVKHRDILASPHAPSISVLIPFYNEAAIIIEKTRLMLSSHYNDFEVVIINDGSTDSSLNKLINYFNLERSGYPVHEQIATNAIKAVYKSQNPAFSRLIVVDKINGGRCDALNAGINVSVKELVLCLNVNCVVEQDALLKMAKPFMEGGAQIIAAGAVVRSVNAADVVKGRVMNVSGVRGLNARFQVLRHLRSSLLRHMAWSRFNSLLQVSRSMAMFHKETLIKCGGYMPECLENNVELIIRMKNYMVGRETAHRVILVPDPICWLPAPVALSTAAGQYKNAVRGTSEGLRVHRKLLFKSASKKLLFSYVALFLSRLAAPVIELVIVITSFGLAAAGYMEWQPFLIVALMVYLSSVAFSLLAIVYEELSFNYTSAFSLPKLFAACILEPLLYYPCTLAWFVSGRRARVAEDPTPKPLHVAVAITEPQVPVPPVLPKSGPDKFADCEIRSLTMMGSRVLDE